jgi:glucoamylase
MPLCWSHAEYVSLVRSRHDGVCFHRVEPAYQRYVVNPTSNRFEIWTLRHPIRRVSRSKILRLVLAEEASITWSMDDWQRTNESQTTHQYELDLWFADFPTSEWPAESTLAFTFFWKRDQHWENRNWQVRLT